MIEEFHRILDQAILPRIRFHDLRHTAASVMLNHSVPVIVVSKVLGHSNPSITLNVYGHLFQERQDEYTKHMEEILLPSPVATPEKLKVRSE
jgi:integrase